MASLGLIRCGVVIGLGALFLSECMGAPVNDFFANRIVLSGATNYILASNVGASREPGEPAHAGSVGGSSIWWTWTAEKSGTILISTAGSTFDTLLGVYLGSSLTNLTEVVSDDDDDLGNLTSLVRFRAIAGETYQIAVDGFQGPSGTVVLRIGPSGYAQPPWNLHDLGGMPVGASNFVNRVLLLDFFETTCPACVDEAPFLVQLRQGLAPQGFEILGVATDNSTNDVFYNVHLLGITYPVVLDIPDIEVAFGALLPSPTKIVIDREGLIQESLVGYNSLGYYQRRIRPLLRGVSSLPLQIRPQPNGIVLAWPATEFGWGVESTTNLTGGTWRTVTNQIVQGPSENNVSLPTGSDGTFYRLKK